MPLWNLLVVKGHLGAEAFFAHAVELTFLLETPYLLVPRGSEVWRFKSKVIGHAKDLKYKLGHFYGAKSGSISLILSERRDRNSLKDRFIAYIDYWQAVLSFTAHTSSDLSWY